jgi:hypothetical protein
MSETPSNFEIANDHFLALLFDCDGTLAETAELHHYALAAAIKNLGHGLPKQWYSWSSGPHSNAVAPRGKCPRGVALTSRLVELGETIFFGVSAAISRPNHLVHPSRSSPDICGSTQRIARRCTQPRDIHHFCAGAKVSLRASKATAYCLESCRTPTIPFVTCRSTQVTASCFTPTV